MSTKPVISPFNQIAEVMVHKYERYLPTAFDESMSLLEKVNKIIQYVNEMGLIVNGVGEQWNEVMEWVMSDGLTDAVKLKLDEMAIDGTLEKIINVDLINSVRADLIKVKGTVPNNFLINAIKTNSYNHFGGLHKLNDGSLLMIYREGPNHLSGGNIISRKSYDGGGKWVEYTIIVDDEYDNRGIGGLVTPDGKIILLYSKHNYDETKTSRGFYLKQSINNGKTWTDETLISIQSESMHMIYGKAINYNGVYLQPYYAYTSNGVRIALLKSTDGDNWSEGGTIYNGTGNITECEIISHGTKLMAVARDESKALQHFYSSDGVNWNSLGGFANSNEYPVSPALTLWQSPNGSWFFVLYYCDRQNYKIRRRLIPVNKFDDKSAWHDYADLRTVTTNSASGYVSAITQGNFIKYIYFDETSPTVADIYWVHESLNDIADFDSGWKAINANTSYEWTHNLGVKPSKIETLISQEPVGLTIMNNGDTLKTASTGTSVRVDTTKIYVGTGTNNIMSYYAGSPPTATNIASGFVRVKLWV